MSGSCRNTSRFRYSCRTDDLLFPAHRPLTIGQNFPTQAASLNSLLISKHLVVSWGHPSGFESISYPCTPNSGQIGHAICNKSRACNLGLRIVACSRGLSTPFSLVPGRAARLSAQVFPLSVLPRGGNPKGTIAKHAAYFSYR